MVEQIVRSYGEEVDHEASLSLVEDAFVVCLSCPYEVVMNLHETVSFCQCTYRKSLHCVHPQFRHCKRHEVNSFIPFYPNEIYVQHPYVKGLREKLTSPGQKARRDLKAYGCRHCLLDSSSHIASIRAPTANDENEDVDVRSVTPDNAPVPPISHVKPDPGDQSKKDAKSHKTSKRVGSFTFDGLRSHVKEK